MPFGRPAVLHASDGQIWVAIHNAGTVFAVDPQSNTVAAQMGPSNNRVCGFDVSTPGALWLANCGPTGAAEGGVVRVDTQSKNVVATIPTNGAKDVATGAGAIWTADTSNSVWRIDPGSNGVVQKIPVGPNPEAITVAYGSVWVTSEGNGTLSRIDPATNTVTATLAVGNPNADLSDGSMGIVAGGGAVWVGNALDNKLYRVDPAANTVTAIDLGSPAPRGDWPTLNLAYGAGTVWALAGLCDIARIDPMSGAITKHYTICFPTTATGTSGMAFAFNSLWVAFPNDQVLWRIQP